MPPVRLPVRLPTDARPLFNDEATQSEPALARTRLFFASMSLLAIYLDTTQPTHDAAVAYGLLGAYVLYSAAVLVAVRFGFPRRQLTAVMIHAVDMIAAALLTLFAEGPFSPFFVLFGFTLLAAAYRWGLWETLLTGLLDAGLYGGGAMLVTTSNVPGGFVDGEFELNRFIIRFTYLVLFAVMIGYLAERQKASRAELSEAASAEERARLARELHDGVIQSLFAIKMRLEVLRLSVPEQSPIISELQRNEELLAREVVNLRTMMFELAPVNTGCNEIPTLLHDLVERFQHASGIATRFVSTGEIHGVSLRACHEITRIVQESLVNIHKHSGARNVLVSLSLHDGRWRLVVDDDGRGFDFEGRLSHDVLDRDRKGPRVIKDRVRLLGGSLTIESKPDSGARLEITLPQYV